MHGDKREEHPPARRRNRPEINSFESHLDPDSEGKREEIRTECAAPTLQQRQDQQQGRDCPADTAEAQQRTRYAANEFEQISGIVDERSSYAASATSGPARQIRNSSPRTPFPRRRFASSPSRTPHTSSTSTAPSGGASSSCARS